MFFGGFFWKELNLILNTLQSIAWSKILKCLFNIVLALDIYIIPRYISSFQFVLSKLENVVQEFI